MINESSCATNLFKSFFVAVIMFIVFEKFQKKFIHVFLICNFVIKCFDLIKNVD